MKTVIQAKRFIVKVPLRNLFVNTYRNANGSNTSHDGRIMSLINRPDSHEIQESLSTGQNYNQ